MMIYVFLGRLIFVLSTHLISRTTERKRGLFYSVPAYAYIYVMLWFYSYSVPRYNYGYNYDYGDTFLIIIVI